jgi:hypothetical protein
VTYPWAHQLNDTEWIPGRYSYMKEGERTSDLSRQAIRERSLAAGIELFETLPAFQQYQGTERLYFDYDPHFTAAGQRVLAEAIAGHIAEHHLQGWCGAKS